MKQETINAIISYLATQPYNKVAQLFEMIKKDMEESQKQT